MFLRFVTHAKDNCPYFQNATQRTHHSFNDPADAEGSDEEKMLVYEKVRDEIISYCKSAIQSL